jgi:hypothetical protein
MNSIHYATVSQPLTTGRWFSLGTQVSSTNKTDRNDITEILLKAALNTITDQCSIYYTVEISSIQTFNTQDSGIYMVQVRQVSLYHSFIANHMYFSY